MMRQLRNVHQSVRPRQDFDERAKIHDLAHGPQVHLADLDFLRETTDHLLRLIGRRFIHRRNRDDARILHIDLDPAFRDDAADHLPARTDHIADSVLLDLHRVDARREGRQVRPRGRQGFRHLSQDIEAACTGLLQGLSHESRSDAGDLNVHLKGRDTLLRAGHLEIHIA